MSVPELIIVCLLALIVGQLLALAWHLGRR
jgi:hypothetical protein